MFKYYLKLIKYLLTLNPSDRFARKKYLVKPGSKKEKKYYNQMLNERKIYYINNKFTIEECRIILSDMLAFQLSNNREFRMQDRILRKELKAKNNI